MTDSPSTTLTVPDDAAGKRIDAWLADALTVHTRSAMSRAIRSGDVLVDGERIKPSHMLRGGEMIVVTISAPATALPTAEEIPLDIAFEDEHLVVVNKAPGMVVHPAKGNMTGTLVNALLHQCPDIKGVGGVMRPGIVHRLDKGTSGLMVAAKNDATHVALTEMLRRREIQRRYDALAWGRIDADGMIEGAIGRDPNNRLRMAIVKGGREARTHFSVTARSEIVTRLLLRLETGRTHQIRVHLMHQQHPIVGDELYGGKGSNWIERLHRSAPQAAAMVKRLERPMLHSASLKFIHPITGEELDLNAAKPKDFHEMAEMLGL